jgi:hypothetical protein
VVYDPKYRTFLSVPMPLETCTMMAMFVLVLQSLNV